MPVFIGQNRVAPIRHVNKVTDAMAVIDALRLLTRTSPPAVGSFCPLFRGAEKRAKSDMFS